MSGAKWRFKKKQVAVNKKAVGVDSILEKASCSQKKSRRLRVNLLPKKCQILGSKHFFEGASCENTTIPAHLRPSKSPNFTKNCKILQKL